MSSETALFLRQTITAGISITTGFFLGLVTHHILGRKSQSIDDSTSADTDSDEDAFPLPLGSRSEYHKLVLCVRTDLKMQKGKIAAQAGHATLGAFKLAQKRDAATLKVWELHAQPKIALQIGSAAEADRLERAAKKKGLFTYKVIDAGRTQIAPGSMTVLAVGPGPASLIDQVTGSLKLL